MTGSRGTDWWRTGVVYQVYPRSFADTNGDGIGDLAGIIAHLDHLAGGPDSLGVDAIWLSPIYPSPGLDLGYDVGDHAGVDPMFGSMADLDRLILEAHRRGIKVLLDLVMNHTSDQHAWFTASRASRSGPYASRYLWRDPAGVDRDGRPIPPNNWLAFFGGPGWTFEPARGQFYQHLFLPQQPDLYWRDPATSVAQWEMVRGWLERGVDGFRLDVFNAFLKDPELRSNPTRRSRSAWGRQVHVRDKDQPDLPALLAEFRRIVDERPGRMSVGELFDGTVEQAAALWAPRHLVFDFDLLSQPWSATAFARSLARREAAFGPDRWPTVTFSNHDQPRHVSRWATVGDQDDLARAAATLLLTLRGTPFLYYGEELGVRGIDVAPGDAIDPPARRADPGFRWWNRDQARAPMPWDGGPNGGFSVSRPWLPLPSDAGDRNVASQRADGGSVLSTYRRLLALRRATPALHAGGLQLLGPPPPGILTYRRTHAAGDALVLANMGSRKRVATVGGDRPARRWRVAFGTHEPGPGTIRDSAAVRLQPLEAIVLVEEVR